MPEETNATRDAGSTWSITLDLLAILVSGIKLDTDEWVLFTFIKNMSRTEWCEKSKRPDGSFWVSNGHLKQQLAALPSICEISEVTLWRKIKRLEDAGLIVRMEDNKKDKRCYLKLGPEADQFANVSISKMKVYVDSTISEMKEQTFKNESRTISNLKEDNNTHYNSTPNIPPTPLDVVSSETTMGGDKPEKRSRTKERSTLKQSQEFYKTQLSLNPLPPEDDVAGRRRRSEYVATVTWMYKGDAEVDGGMGDTVMTMGKQLTYQQYNLLRDESRLTDYQVRQYLIRMHTWTDRHKNNTIYSVIARWARDDIKKGSLPPREKSANGYHSMNGQSVSKPSSTNNDYRA